MPCFYPIKGFRSADGSGKITQNRSQAFSDLPITIGCGQCRGCRLEHSREWAVRLMHEAQMHPANSFITLTYSNQNLPTGGSLNLEDFRNFMKRLRRARAPKKIRFYQVGEYGDENLRPHHHALLFNEDFRGDRKPHGESKRGDPKWISETLEDLWGNGRTEIGTVTSQSAGYCARYVMKKITGPKADEHYTDKTTGLIRKAEYSTMSRRPGIGAKWIEKYFSDVYPSDEVIHQGHALNPPSFYDEYCKKRDPDLMAQLKSQRKANGVKHDDDNTWERLEVREKVLIARTRLLERNL